MEGKKTPKNASIYISSEQIARMRAAYDPT
jgi:hypothetical protein